MAADQVDEIRTALEKAIGFQYDIHRLLGRGGMGAVYQAHERALDRPVAIKVLPPEVAGTATARDRFLREARTAARLTHPNIVPLFTFGETAGLIYYVMGYVEGESLQQRIDRVGRIEPERTGRILEQLARALDYAHALGVVHRDVKPDNVLIERGSGEAKLTDFGIAKRATDGATLTGTGLLMGTPRYMSPEQASGDRDLDGRSDIYALGLVGYAMLTGQPPFEGATVQDTLRQQVMRDAPSLRKLLPDAPSSIVVTVDRALQKDPKGRWQSAKAMADAINDEDAGDTGTNRPGQRPGLYAPMMLIMTAVTWNAAWFFGWRESWTLAVVLGLAPFGMVFDYLAARYKDKKSPAEIRRIFTEAPRWWPYWWPERARRKDDVWRRLPLELRENRNIASLGIGVGLLTLEGIFLVLSAIPAGSRMQLEWRGSFLWAMVVGLASSIGLIVLAAVRAWLWGRKRGLTFEEASHVASQPTARFKYWARPEIARLLAPLTDDSGAAEPRTHAELVAAVAAAVQELPEHRSAADAARSLAAAIDQLDEEIARLVHDTDPAEIARLEKRLEAPGNDDIRKLYASQLELLRQLAQRRLDAESRRARYAELLRTLWLQVASLRAQVAADNAQAVDLSGRIRAICASVEYEVHGLREATAVIKLG